MPTLIEARMSVSDGIEIQTTRNCSLAVEFDADCWPLEVRSVCCELNS